jgi:hypothetical protein
VALGSKYRVSRFLWNMPEDSILKYDMGFVKDII